jgi:hypothetical protein
MDDETSHGPAGAPHGGGCGEGGTGDSSPFQTRAPFLKNWSWESVVSINKGACARGGAQHGFNSETAAASAEDWTRHHCEVVTLLATFERLREFHRRAPFLFFNGNTFAAIGRELSLALFSDLPPLRKREVSSAAAHYIAGVLDRDAMVQIIEHLCEMADLTPGTRVQTLRGSLDGEVIRLLDDGRVLWRTETGSELIALPESLKILPS